MYGICAKHAAKTNKKQQHESNSFRTSYNGIAFNGSSNRNINSSTINNFYIINAVTKRERKKLNPERSCDTQIFAVDAQSLIAKPKKKTHNWRLLLLSRVLVPCVCLWLCGCVCLFSTSTSTSTMTFSRSFSSFVCVDWLKKWKFFCIYNFNWPRCWFQWQICAAAAAATAVTDLLIFVCLLI